MVQLPWSPSPVAGLGIGRREGGRGGQGERQPSGFWRGPRLGRGADVKVEPSGELPGPWNPVLRQGQAPGLRLLPPELAQMGDFV